MRAIAAALALAACGGSGGGTAASDAPPDTVHADAPPVDGPIPAAIYKQACDGSAGVALDATHFLDLADDDQVARIYTRGAGGDPVQQLDLTDLLAPVSSEVDLEDATRRGDRIYVIGSHGRNTSGALRPDRQRIAAFDLVAGSAVPALAVTPVGRYEHLLADITDAANWQTPDTDAIAALAASIRLDKQTDASLAPEDSGVNIEGLVALPDGTLALGFRNPQVAGKALVVTLVDADALLAGTDTKATFGHAVLLDLGGNGIRGFARRAGAVLLIAGPHGGSSTGTFSLETWSGASVDPPSLLQPLTAGNGSNPEALVVYPDDSLQILHDAGDATINTANCKTAPLGSKQFDDVEL